MTDQERILIVKNLPLFRNAEVKVKFLKGGMTNHNFVVTTGKQKYVARFAPATLKLLGLSQKREIANYKSASKIGIGAKFIAYYPKFRLLIVEYLPGKIVSRKMAGKRKTLKEIVIMLKKLHARTVITGSFNPIDRARRYIKLAEKSKKWKPKNLSKLKKDFERAIIMIKPFSKKDSCHTDLMLENILITPRSKAMLLDWEYASKSDYRYDLAMFSVKAGFGKKEDATLAKMYDSKKAQAILRTLPVMKALVYYAEASYGFLQNSISKKKVNYKDYAVKNFRKFEGIMAEFQ